jgi:hypothetical protein
MNADAARARLLVAHESLLATALDCADAVAADWDGEGTTDRDAVVRRFRAALDEAGVLERCPAVLADAVAATGGELRAEPVATPPYVTVTGAGLVLRGTTATGRLVVTLRAFDVRRRPTRYVRGPDSVPAALDVAVRGR